MKKNKLYNLYFENKANHNAKLSKSEIANYAAFWFTHCDALNVKTNMNEQYKF